VVIILSVVIISQYIYLSKHHTVHLKYIQFLLEIIEFDYFQWCFFLYNMKKVDKIISKVLLKSNHSITGLERFNGNDVGRRKY